VATLRVDNVTKIFPPLTPAGKPVRALQGVSFEMSGNVFVSLVGPSGCGKSTLLNITSGVDTPTSGKVSLTHSGGQAGIGYVFQDPRLLPWRTVMDNLLYVTDEDRQSARSKAQTYLEMVGLGDVADMYPGQLSGGMQQRVGIARAFFVDPDLLLMDEPFSHLDAITARGLREQLQGIWNETRKMVLFVTHDVREAVELSNRLILMAHGGQIYADIDITLPDPRKSSDSAVAILQAEILGYFEKMEAELGPANPDVD
jgi:NitT/TauT family transport system ATP-binding protein